MVKVESKYELRVRVVYNNETLRKNIHLYQDSGDSSVNWINISDSEWQELKKLVDGE